MNNVFKHHTANNKKIWDFYLNHFVPKTSPKIQQQLHSMASSFARTMQNDHVGPYFILFIKKQLGSHLEKKIVAIIP